MIIVICGKSASGKDSLFKELVKDGYTPLISTTSRPMRVGEENGREYYFISKEEFEEKLRDNKFIEYRTYNTLVNNVPDTWFYGMEKQDLDPDKNYIVILDLQGAAAFKEIYGDQVRVVYIKVSNLQRTAWAMSRGSFDETEWRRRLKDDNIKFSSDKINTHCDYVIRNVGTINELKEKFNNIVLDIQMQM